MTVSLPIPEARSITATQPVRYEVLDGLRGAAAIGVLIFHLSIVGAPQLLARGYMAVDFFFILSGFVLSNAYAGRLRTLPLREFLRIRLVRLLPLCTLGLALGTSYFLLRLFTQQQSQYELADILSGSTWNLFLLPKPWITQAPTDTVFAANTPLWSLSVEMIVNVLWAALLFRFSKLAMSAVLALTGAGLFVLIIHHGTADLGATWPTYAGGVFRALYGFCAGVMIWRYRPMAIGSSLLSWICVFLLAAILSMPGGGAVLEAVLVLIILPLLVYVAVLSDGQVRRPAFSQLGRLSYPLYVIHVPILMISAGMFKALHLTNAMPIIAFVILPACLLASVMLDRFYDSPVRKLVQRLMPAARSPP
ncbi:MAG: acyltransferase [Hyphomonadaceae bacterium]|nr:acyltransferase [Hyphomonadaceae bacterium]